MNARTWPALALLCAAAIAGCDSQKADWQDAEETGTAAAYEEFLENHPDGEHARQAEQRIAALRRSQRWEQAQADDSVAAYQAFVEEFPDSEEAEQARTRLAELERRQQWQALRDSTDIVQLREFAERHGNTPVADQARERIARLEAQAREAQAREQARVEAERERRRAEQAVRTHRVQVAALRSEQDARAGARRLEERLASELGDRKIEIQQSGSYHLLRTEPMSEDDARALCKRLKARDQDCLVVSR